MERREMIMYEKAIIRIGCILLSLVILTGCVLYLSSDNINRPYYENKRTKATNHPDIQQNYYDEEDVGEIEEPKKETAKQNKQISRNDEILEEENPQKLQEDNQDADNTSHESETSSSGGKVVKYIDSEIPNVIVSYSKGKGALNSSSAEPTSSKSSSGLSSSSNSSNSSSSSISSGPQEIITAQTNNDIAISISKAYNIKIIIARTSSDYSNQIIKNYVQDEHLINETLLVVSRYLSSVAEGLLTDINIDKIVLVGDHSGKTAVMQTSQTLFVPCLRDIKRTEIAHEVNQTLIHSFSEKINAASLQGSLVAMNPSEFSYGDVSTKYIYSTRNLLNGYFISQKAQLSEVDDAKELFQYILNYPTEFFNMPKTAVIYPKFIVVCETIKEIYPCLYQYVMETKK